MGNATNSNRARDRDSRLNLNEKPARGALSMIAISVARTMIDGLHAWHRPLSGVCRNSSFPFQDPGFESNPWNDARQEIAPHPTTDEPGRMISIDQNGRLRGHIRVCRDARRRLKYIGPDLRDQADRLVSKRLSGPTVPPGSAIRRLNGHVAVHSQPMVSFRSRFHALRVERQPSSGMSARTKTASLSKPASCPATYRYHTNRHSS